MKKVVIKVKMATRGADGKTKFLGLKGSTVFESEVGQKEMLAECIDRIFGELGLDTTELEKVLDGVEEEDQTIFLQYHLETDPLSLLEFLISEEGRDSGLELIDLA
jgi:DNA helicase TIP49 (TBP-interacting protein)